MNANTLFSGAAFMGGTFFPLIADLLGSPAIVTLFSFFIAATLLLLFMLTGALLVWLALLLWASIVSRWFEGDTEKAGFDETNLYDPLLIALLELGSAIAAGTLLLFNSIGSAASAVFSNLTLLVLVILLFTFVFVITQWHHLFIFAYANFSNCVLAPLWRTLLLPFINLLAFALSATVLPVFVFLRRIVQSVTVLAVERALECSFEAVVAVITGILGAAQQFGFATVQWVRFEPAQGGNGLSPLVAGPDYFPAAHQLGLAINQSVIFADCLCEPLAEPLFQPLFEPFAQDAFPTAINATAGITSTFFTQMLLRPVVESLNNSANNPDAPLSETFYRPTLNTTIDLTSTALREWTHFGDSFGTAIFQALTNLFVELTGLQLPEEPKFPERSFFTLMVAAPTDTFVLQPLKILANIVFNVDTVFTTADGFLFFRLDDVFNAARFYANVFGDLFKFVADWLRALGIIIADALQELIGSPRGMLHSVPPLAEPALIGSNGFGLSQKFASQHTMTLAVDSTSRPLRPLSVEGDLIKFGLDYVASVFDRFSCIVPTLTEAAIQIVKVISELPPGTIWRAISTLPEFGFPNPLVFPQEYWGDFQDKLCFVTQIPNNSADFFLPFSISIRDCIDDPAAEELCAQTALEGFIPADAPEDTVTVLASPEQLEMLFDACAPNLDPQLCQPVLVQDPGRSSVNEFEVALQAQVEVLRCTMLLASLLAPDAQSFAEFTARLGDVIVEALLIPLDWIVHIDRVVSTPYIGNCVPYERVLDSLDLAARALSNGIRKVGEKFHGTPVCILVPDEPGPTPPEEPRSSDAFCCVANGVDSSVLVVTQFSRQVITVFRVVVNALFEGVSGEPDPELIDGLLDSLEFETTFEEVENVIFDVFCLPLQLVPSSVTCTNQTERVLRTELATAVSTILSDVVLLVPRTALNGTVSLVKGVDQAIGGDVSGGINTLFTALLTPLIDLGANLFIQSGSLITCIDQDSDVGEALIALGDFLRDLGDVFVKLLVDFALLALQLFFGFFELVFATCVDDTVEPPITGPCTDILEGAIDQIGVIITQIGILLFGKGFVCTLQDATCFFAPSSASQTLIDTCLKDPDPYSFAFCRPVAGRPGTVDCFAQRINCAGGGCPDEPFGCCGNAFFPVLNTPDPDTQMGQELITAQLNFTLFRTEGDERDPACTPWVGLEDDDDDGTEGSCDDIAGPEPYPKFFFDNSSLAALRCSFGQTSDTDCPLFQDINECEDVVLLNRFTGLPIPDDDDDPERKRVATYGVENHHGTPLTAAFCRTYLVDFGMDEARELSEQTANAIRSLEKRDRTAVRCYRGALVDPAAQTFTEFSHERDRRFNKLVGSFGSAKAIVRSLGVSVESSRPAAKKIYNARRVRAPTIARRRERRPKKLGLSELRKSLVKTVHTMGQTSAQAQRKRSRQPHTLHERPTTARMVRTFAKNVRHRRSLVFGSLDAEEMRAQLVAATMHASDAIESAASVAHTLSTMDVRVRVANAPHTIYTSAMSPFADRKPILAHAFVGLRDMAVHYKSRFEDALRRKFNGMQQSGAKTLASVAETVRQPKSTPARDRVRIHRLSVQQQAARGLRTPFMTTSSSPFEPQECDPDEQLVCTGCAIFDDGLREVEAAVRSTGNFYANETGGFGEILRQFELSANQTLIDPAGSDTFTTIDKAVPFIGARLLCVRWPWLWDYSELKSLLVPSGEPVPDFEGATQAESLRVAAKVGREDLDNRFYPLVKPIIESGVNFLESIVAAVGVGTFGDGATAVFNRYVVCDYDSSMYCAQPASIGLFDGIVVSALIAALVVAIVSLVPGGSALSAMIAPVLFALLVPWIAYGASPLCTVPSFVGGIFALPTCIAMDLNTLIGEIIPQCPPVPPALIAPDDLAMASMTLCATCDAVPNLLPCSEAVGFLDGLDNTFFMLASLFDQELKDNVADAMSIILPSAAASAAVYTPQHLQILADAGQIGAICNILTIGNLGALLLILQVLALIVIGLAFGLFALAIALGLFGIAAIRVLVLLYEQQYIGFVINTGDKKLKVA